jgi:hypothetical protein
MNNLAVSETPNETRTPVDTAAVAEAVKFNPRKLIEMNGAEDEQ